MVVQQQRPGRIIFRAFESTINRCKLVRVYRNLFTIFTETLKRYHAFDQCEQSVILAAADVVAGVDLSAALTINDVAGFDRFAAEFLAAETLSA
jgi:hypothetical protein